MRAHGHSGPQIATRALKDSGALDTFPNADCHLQNPALYPGLPCATPPPATRFVDFKVVKSLRGRQKRFKLIRRRSTNH
jgi:hypothetical protein